MTVKEFFKSTAFKCIITLLCVLLVSGIFLTIMNSLLQVTDQERFDRAINKIYGKSVKTESVAVADYNSNATIVEAYKIKDDGNYLVKSTGKGGFDNGTVTCWIVVEVKGGAVNGIGKVVIDSNTAQSYISNINDKFLSSFSANYTDGVIYNPNEGFIKTGATRSANAICNAVNGALDYVNALFGNVSEDIYADFLYIDNIETKQSSHVYNEADNTVTFTVVSKGYGMANNFTSDITVNAKGVITKFEIVKYGSTDSSYDNKAEQNVEQMYLNKDLAGILAILNGGTSYPGDGSNKFVVSGASNSTYSLYNAALFAAANYSKCMPEQTPDEGEDGGEDNGEEGGSENE